MIQVRVLLFATLKDKAGTNRLSLAVRANQPTVRDVRETLAGQFPDMVTQVQAAIAAVNSEYASDNDTVHEGDEIAFFPPVSGGAPDVQPEIFQLADAPLDLDMLLAAITTSATGAICVFSGMVRGETQRPGQPQQTNYLEYEAYAPMALAKMNQVAQEIRAQWPLVLGIAIVQRVGRLEIGQNTILIACGAGHRDDGCFEAARYGIDRLKEIVPVWKREVGPDGAAWVEGNYMPTLEDRASAVRSESDDHG